MLQHTDMNEVWFVVSPQNPFKERKSLLQDHHRLELVRRAVDDNYSLRVCDVEMHLPIPSYTVVTLARLAELHPDKEFCLIMGADNLEHFDRWRNYQYILDHYHIYVFPRPGFSLGTWENHPAVHWVDFPQMEISSSYIRDEIAAGRSVRYLTPEPVYQYLTEMHFYE